MKVRLQTEQETAFSSAFDGCGATCTNVQIISVSSDEQKTIFEGAPDGDTVSVPINSNGKYLVKLEGDDYIDTEMVFDVKCDITKCRSCRPSFVLPVSPTLDVDEAKIMLSWANLPNTLQIFSYERGCAEKNTAYVGEPINGNGLSDLVPSWQECSQLCKDTDGCAHWTWISDKFRNPLLANICSMKKETGDIKKVPGVVSGAAGCEDISPPVVKVSTVSTISLSGISQSMPGKVGMIFVENLSKVPKFSSDSHVRVTITDGATVAKNQMDLSNYGGENFWIAGCYKLDDNGVINFSPEASFLNSRPDEEVPDYCLRFYDA